MLSIWSAGCSSGEEPYTLSIYLKEFFGTQASQWDTRVLATDISQQAMAKAKAGVYQPPADMPDAWLQALFCRKETSGTLHGGAPIRDNVIFRTFNLMDPIRFRLKFDVIFCRNVMIYFDQPTRDALVRRFYDAMNPNRLSVHQPLRIPGPDSAVPHGGPGSLPQKVTLASHQASLERIRYHAPNQRKVRVLVVDDSAVARTFLIEGLSAYPNIEVVGYASQRFGRQGKISSPAPDVMTLDVEMPGTNGIDFLKQLLPSHPLPVILVSSLNLRVFDALAAGAVDFVRKPDGTESTRVLSALPGPKNCGGLLRQGPPPRRCLPPPPLPPPPLPPRWGGVAECWIAPSSAWAPPQAAQRPRWTYSSASLPISPAW